MYVFEWSNLVQALRSSALRPAIMIGALLRATSSVLSHSFCCLVAGSSKLIWLPQSRPRYVFESSNLVQYIPRSASLTPHAKCLPDVLACRSLPATAWSEAERGILPHSPQARRGVSNIEKSKVAFKRSFRMEVFTWTF